MTAQAHGGVLELPWWAAAAASAVPALSLAASLHLLVIVLRHARHDAQESARGAAPIEVTETREVSAHEEAPNGGVPARRNARPVARSASTSRARLEAMIRRAAKRGEELDSRAAAKRLGVTPAHARRLLTEVRKSHAQEPVTN